MKIRPMKVVLINQLVSETGIFPSRLKWKIKYKWNVMGGVFVLLRR
jgi:hypothetical protein